MEKKILFEHSIFLHQKTGSISKYICNLNKYLNKKKFTWEKCAKETIKVYNNL